jgi:hypothetical protein
MGLSDEQRASQAKDIISSLPAKHKKEIKSWLDFIVSSTKEKNTEFSVFYSVLSDFLLKKGIHSQPMNIFLRNSKIGVGTFDRLSSYITSVCGQTTQQERIGLYGMFLDCLISFMDTRSIPISVNSMISSLGYVPGLVRIYYPGYAEAGLLLKISNMPVQPFSKMDV